MAAIQQPVKKLLYASTFFGVMLLVMNFVRQQQRSLVRDVVVSIQPLADGHNLLEEEDVLHLITKRFELPLTDMTLRDIDAERVESVLEEDPFIRNADVWVDASGQVHVALQQREPILRIKDANGLDYYLDSAGVRMPLSRRHTARVMVATGSLPPHTDDYLEKPKSLLKDVFQLAEMINSDVFLKALVEQLYVDKKGEFVLVPKLGSSVIQFGRIKDAADKLKRIKIFYSDGLPYTGWNQYKALDVRFKNQVVARRFD